MGLNCNFNTLQTNIYPNLWSDCGLYSRLPYGYSPYPTSYTSLQHRYSSPPYTYQPFDPSRPYKGHLPDRYGFVEGSRGGLGTVTKSSDSEDYEDYPNNGEYAERTKEDQRLGESVMIQDVRAIMEPEKDRKPKYPVRDKQEHHLPNREHKQPPQLQISSNQGEKSPNHQSSSYGRRPRPPANHEQLYPPSNLRGRPPVMQRRYSGQVITKIKYDGHPSKKDGKERSRGKEPMVEERQSNSVDRAASSQNNPSIDTRSPLVKGGFFGVVMPILLGVLFFLGFPLVQVMFAGASIISAFVLSGGRETPEAFPAAALDSAIRYVLVTVLNSLSGFSKESRAVAILHYLPVCINTTLLNDRLAENRCKGDFLEYILPQGAGILKETKMARMLESVDGSSILPRVNRMLHISLPGSHGCRDGSIPDIVAKIGNLLAYTLGDCASKE